MKPEVTGRKDLGLHATDRPDENRLDPGGALVKCIRDC
jgi:hypothetical protein